MFSALVSAGSSTSSGISVANLLVLIVLLAIGWPVFSKLRRSVSEKRKARWAEEALNNRPAAGSESDDSSD